MNKNDELDRSIIAELIMRLSELDMKLSDPDLRGLPHRVNVKKCYLFSFELNGSASAEEYRKYFEFLSSITDILREMGIHMGNNGYAYIMDAVKIILDRESYDLRLKTDVYTLIAGKYHIRNVATVEHSIRNAISSAYEDHRRIPGINNMSVFVRRPTNKQFLIYVAGEVQQLMCETLMSSIG